MRMRRAAGLAAVAVAGVATLAGCQKPPPAVTVWSGTTSQYEPALCWSDTQLQPGACAQDIVQGARTDGIPVIPNTSGNVLGISVDPSVASIGWVPVIQGKPIASVQNETYFRLTIPDSLNQDLNLQVVAGSDTAPQGVWLFRLQP